MKNIKFYFIIPFTILFALLSSGCSSNAPKENDAVEIKIAAAASVTHALTEIGKLFEEETGTKVTFSFGSTGQLAEQIENGAPFDVFASADIITVDRLNESDNIIQDSQQTYAFGKIGIATLKEHSFDVETLDDFLKPEIVKIAIANPDHAPFGLAAKQALEASGLWDEVNSKIIYGRNIADTLAFIETGNAEAGVVALSLVDHETLNFHPIDESLYEPIGQSIAVLSETTYETEARDFIDFIRGPKGKPIMENYGFVVPVED